MDINQFQRIAKALADPRRFEVLEVIAAGGEMCCGAVVERFPVAQATISHHLKELTDAGLVETRAEGQFKYLRARPEVLAEYVEQLNARIGSQRKKSGSRAVASSPKRTAKV
ncbi:MAG: helix-turn-helix transcriptional regulator [Pyrinomonadaceae bacterium]|jgi:ArsR family transcriptional regulator|nr:helix-turn-helix transcriptional regulator [Pyrinomonadaceae bacterium]